MLVTTRKMDGTEKSRIIVYTSDGPIVFETLGLRSGRAVSVGISAPTKCEIWREEMLDQPEATGRQLQHV